MEEIINYIKINENLVTSGQPTEKQFEDIKNEGFEVIINLALHNASNAIENEDKTVTDLEMAYFHIPVDFENPKKEQVSLFLNLLTSLKNKKVWVHCALNYRVTVFCYLYHKHILHTPFEEINFKVFDEWTPSEKWQDIMKTPYEQLSLVKQN